MNEEVYNNSNHSLGKKFIERGLSSTGKNYAKVVKGHSFYYTYPLGYILHPRPNILPLLNYP